MSTEKHQWWCRKVFVPGFNEKTGMKNDKEYHQLVWGLWKAGKLFGETYHTLHGATSGPTIQAYADDLNRRNVPPSKVPDFRPANNKTLDKDQMQLPLMMTPNFKEKK